MEPKIFAILGASAALLSVVLGSFGAHALKHHLSDGLLNAFEVGIKYQMYHALGLIAIALLLFHFPHPLLTIAGWTMFSGMVIFSASLYTLALTGFTAFGAITPIGGVILILSWLFLVIGIWKS